MAYKFINPYNFVPLSNGVSKANEEDRNLSGVIEYSLLTKTPLFIPNSSNDHAILPDEYIQAPDNSDYHKSYEFYAYEDLSGQTACKKDNELKMPVIPGSEVRGMLRSNYEILTNSCMAAYDERKVFSRRNKQVFEAGLLYKNADGSFDLFKAEDCLLKTEGKNNLKIKTEWTFADYNSKKSYIQSELDEGQRVFIRKRKRDKGKTLVEEIRLNKSGSQYIEGYVILGAAGPQMVDKKKEKHCAHVFVLMPNNLLGKNVDVSSLSKTLSFYGNDGKSDYSKYDKAWTSYAKKGSGYFPVYYSTVEIKSEKKYYMLSPAAITREVYKNTPNKVAAGYDSCKDKAHLCPACSLFGTVMPGGKVVASRIRMSDMKVSNSDVTAASLYEKPIMLKELSSPKLNNVEFYLQRPKDAVFWTYDYYITENGKVVPYTALINGRKFYWHNINMCLNNAAAQEKTIRNTTVRPVKKSVKFSGKLFFDGISRRELNELIYLLNAGEETDTIEEKKHGFKLGTGKPLGLGSVAIQVDSINIRSIVKNDKLKCIEYVDNKEYEYSVPEIDSNIRENFEKMTSFEALNEAFSKQYCVSYPHKDNPEDDIYEWFEKNHKAYKFDKKEMCRVADGMPNKREGLYFVEYMEAMHPELAQTDTERKLNITPKISDKGNNRPNGNDKPNGNRRPYESNKTNWNNRDRNNRDNGNYKK